MTKYCYKITFTQYGYRIKLGLNKRNKYIFLQNEDSVFRMGLYETSTSTHISQICRLPN